MINEFKTLIGKRGGLAKTNRFSVVMSLPPGISEDSGRDLTLLCESAQMPGKQIMSLEWSLYGHTIKIPTGFMQEDVTLIFNVTEDYYAKNIMDKWQNAVISNITFNCAYDKDFKRDIYINQLNEQDVVVYTTHLLGAYPITVQPISMDNGADGATQKVAVQFCYNDFRHISHV